MLNGRMTDSRDQIHKHGQDILCDGLRLFAPLKDAYPYRIQLDTSLCFAAFLPGTNAHIRVHDNLDSNIAWYKVLINSNELFGPLNATIPQVINGLPRGAYGTEFSGIVWLHALFPTMLASEIVYRVDGQQSVKQYYAVDLFRQIQTYIGKPQRSYRAASIGLHPSIAQYNGFYALDTYNN